MRMVRHTVWRGLPGEPRRHGGPARAGLAPRRRKTRLAGRVRGSATAPVTVYEMSDFQCPYCRTFALDHVSGPRLERTSPPARCAGSSSIFRSPASTERRGGAAETAMCAAQQGTFWPVHDLLYHHQDIWAPLKEPGAFFLTLADSAKISRPAARLRALAGNAGGRPGRRAGRAARRRQQHADVLHRRRTAGRRAAAADLPPGTGLDSAEQGEGGQAAPDDELAARPQRRQRPGRRRTARGSRP